MKADLENELYDMYPELLKEIKGEYGFECDDGWYRLIASTLSALNAVAAPNTHVLQIKEKFGCLRIYLDTYSDGVIDILADAEGRSSRTCEQCGAKGGLRNDAIRIMVRCDDCAGK